MKKSIKREDYDATKDVYVIGATFEDAVDMGAADTAGDINDYMDMVRETATIQREFYSAMPAYFAGKKEGRIDFVAISHDRKTVEIIEVKSWGRINEGMEASEAAFQQAIGGAVAVQARHPGVFDSIIITSIARQRDIEAGTHVDTIKSEAYSDSEVEMMGYMWTK